MTDWGSRLGWSVSYGLGFLRLRPWLVQRGGLGEELGWRGYLATTAHPLPRGRCSLILGLCWWLWHLPLV
jgi:hypothetical protein